MRRNTLKSPCAIGFELFLNICLFFLGFSGQIQASNSKLCAEFFSSSTSVVNSPGSKYVMKNDFEAATNAGIEISGKAISKLKKSGWRPQNGYEKQPAHWKYDSFNTGDPIDRYAQAFSKILSLVSRNSDFKDVFEDLIKRSTRFLDLFGSGLYALGRTPSKNIFGVRFDPLKKDSSPKELPIEILGDAFNPKTWNTLDRKSGEDGTVRRFDLITLNPLGGWEYKSKSDSSNIEEAYAMELLREVLIGNSLARLSKNGVFLFKTSLERGFGSNLEAQESLAQLKTKIDADTAFNFEYLLVGDEANPYEIQGIVYPKKLR